MILFGIFRALQVWESSNTIWNLIASNLFKYHAVIVYNKGNKERQKENVAESRLYDATMKYISYQSKINGSVAPVVPSSQVPLGRITLPCRDDTGFVSTLTVSKGELREFHSFLVQ